MSVHNIRLASVVVQNTPLPLGGETTFASFAPEARYTVQRNLSGKPIFSKVNNPLGVVTITCHPDDLCNFILRGLVNLDDATLGQTIGAGSITDSAGNKVAWAEGKITQEAGINVEEASSVVSWTITCGRFEIVAVPR